MEYAAQLLIMPITQDTLISSRRYTTGKKIEFEFFFNAIPEKTHSKCSNNK